MIIIVPVSTSRICLGLSVGRLTMQRRRDRPVRWRTEPKGDLFFTVELCHGDWLTHILVTCQFFFVFVVWSVFFALWTFATLLALNVRAATREKKSIDPQHIVVIAMYVPPRVPSTRKASYEGS